MINVTNDTDDAAAGAAGAGLGRLPLDDLMTFFNLVMGRIAGVTATETRERLLGAAAEVFAARGFDGARVATSRRPRP